MTPLSTENKLILKRSTDGVDLEPSPKRSKSDRSAIKQNIAILNLPSELIIKIFSKLSLNDLSSLYCTSSQFRNFFHKVKTEVFVNAYRDVFCKALGNAIKNDSPHTINFLLSGSIEGLRKLPTLPLLKQLVLRTITSPQENNSCTALIKVDSRFGEFPIYEDGKGILVTAIKMGDRKLVENCLNHPSCPPLDFKILVHALNSKDVDIFRNIFNSPRIRKYFALNELIKILFDSTEEILRVFFNSYSFHHAERSIDIDFEALVHTKKWSFLNEFLYLPMNVDVSINIPLNEVDNFRVCLLNFSEFIKTCGQSAAITVTKVREMYKAMKAKGEVPSREDLHRALLNACYSGNIDVVDCLLEEGAPLEDRDYMAIRWAVLYNEKVANYFIQNWERYKIPKDIVEVCCYLSAQGKNEALVHAFLQMVNEIYKDNEERKRQILHNTYLEAMMAPSSDQDSIEKSMDAFLKENINVINEMCLFPLKLLVENFPSTSHQDKLVEDYYAFIGEDMIDYKPEHHKDFLIYLMHSKCSFANINYYLALFMFYVNLGPQRPMTKNKDGVYHICNTFTEVRKILEVQHVEDIHVRNKLHLLKEWEERLNALIRYVTSAYSPQEDNLPCPEDLILIIRHYPEFQEYTSLLDRLSIIHVPDDESEASNSDTNTDTESESEFDYG